MTIHLRAAWSLCLLACLCGMGPLRAQEIHLRRAVEIRMSCRAQPGLAAPALARILPGDQIRVQLKTQVGQVTWYVDESHSYAPSPPCWVFGPATVELDEKNPGPGWLAMLDRVLARKDVKFEEYVEVDNALQAADSPEDRKAIDESGVIQFRRLQMISRALSGNDMERRTVERNPLKRAWVLGHKELIYYYEPDSHWYLWKAPYRELLERHKSEPWAEEIAWAIAAAGPGDECYTECVLNRMVEGPLWFLSRYPAGAHAHAAMKDATELASYAARMAAYEASHPEAANGFPDGLVQKARDSVSKLALPETREILRSLDEIERQGKRAR